MRYHLSSSLFSFQTPELLLNYQTLIVNYDNQIFDKTLLLNPGAVCGINFDKGDYDRSTYAIYDTQTNSAEIIEIK